MPARTDPVVEVERHLWTSLKELLFSLKSENRIDLFSPKYIHICPNLSASIRLLVTSSPDPNYPGDVRELLLGNSSPDPLLIKVQNRQKMSRLSISCCTELTWSFYRQVTSLYPQRCIFAAQGETRAGGIHERTRESLEADSHATVSLSSSLLVLLCPSPTSNLWTCYLDNNNDDDNNNNNNNNNNSLGNIPTEGKKNNNNNTRWTAVFQFSKVTQVSQCQNATILGYIGTKDGGAWWWKLEL